MWRSICKWALYVRICSMLRGSKVGRLRTYGARPNRRRRRSPSPKLWWLLNAALDQRGDQLQRDRAAVDVDWTRAREAKAKAEQLEAKADKQRAALDRQAIQLERAKAKCDQEAQALRDTEGRTADFLNFYKHRLAGLGAVEDVRDLLRKPELVGMLEFIDKNPDARAVMEIIRDNEHMAGVFLDLAGPDVQPTGWVSPTAQAAEDWAGPRGRNAEAGARWWGWTSECEPLVHLTSTGGGVVWSDDRTNPQHPTRPARQLACHRRRFGSRLLAVRGQHKVGICMPC